MTLSVSAQSQVTSYEQLAYPHEATLMLRASTRYLFSAAMFLQATLAARAASVENVEDWAKKFQGAASLSDTEAMQGLIDSAADPQLKSSNMVSVLKSALSGKTFLYAEQFNNESLGTFFKRVNIAVLYKEAAIFYAFEFVRGEGGWRILGMGADGNVNNILARRWPP